MATLIGIGQRAGLREIACSTIPELPDAASAHLLGCAY
jgi:hypothetical protein